MIHLAKACAAVATVVLVAVACQDRSLSEEEPPHYSSSLRPWRCNFQLVVQPEATHADLAEVLRSNSLQVCGWREPLQLLAFNTSSQQQKCELPNHKNIDILHRDAPAPEPNDRQCEGPEIGVPDTLEMAKLKAFCFEAKLPSGGRLFRDENLGVGTALFFFSALPVAAVSPVDGQAVLWADFDNYLWPDTFIADARAAANELGFVLDIAPCSPEL